MKKKPTSKQGAANQNGGDAANAPTGESQAAVTPIEETSPFITPQMASCSMFAGDPTSVDPKDQNP